MTKNDILQYVKHTPFNTNPVILFQMLEEYKETPEVSSSNELEQIFSDSTKSTVALNSSVDMSKESQITHKITIDGQGNTINTSVQGKILTLIAGGSIKNVNIESTADNTDWHSSYGIQFYNSKGTVENTKITGGNAAIIVNSSEVTLKGKIDVSGNTFGGIEVSKGSALNLNPGILNINGATIINTTEEYGKPTIWIDGITEEEGIVNGAENMTKIIFTKEDGSQQIQYYLNPQNSIKPE